VTAIVGLVHDDRVYIGGDSAGVAGYVTQVRSDAKVFRNGPYLFGFTSSFRMGQLLRYALQPPAVGADLDKFMVTTFVDAVRDCLKAGGFATKESEAEHGGTFVVGVAGRLFRIDSDYQVGEQADRFDAVGCGQEFALGALHATAGMPPKRRINLALEAAARYSAGVTGPFICLSAKGV